MSARNIKTLSIVATGATDNVNGTVIAAGKTLVIGKFGAADVAIGDAKSSLYILKWGSSGGGFAEVAVISVTGNTFEYDLKEQLVGDGVSFLRITRSHQSAVDKRCPCWVKASDNS